jgi:hypothetical protein
MTIPLALCSLFTGRREDGKDREESSVLNGISNNEQGNFNGEVNARSKKYSLNHNDYSLFDIKHFTPRREGPRRMLGVSLPPCIPSRS